MEDLRTSKQRARDLEHGRIIQLYLTYKSNPESSRYSDHRIFEAIAHRTDVSISTVAGVRRILVEAGVYQNKR